MSKNLAPIAFFVYKRPRHTMEAINALKNNIYSAESELFVFSDAAKTPQDEAAVKQVREIVNNLQGFGKVTVIEQEHNLGLANSIISGVTKLCNEYGRAIVLEDDLVSSPYFLKYMNEGLKYYDKYKNVFTVCGFSHNSRVMKKIPGYPYDVYFTHRNSSYGWGTWLDRWKLADWDLSDFESFISDRKKQKMFNYSGDDLTNMLIAQVEGKIDSWSIRWTYSHFKNNALAVYPLHSYIENIGFDGSGVHYDRPVNNFGNDLNKSNSNPVFVPPYIDEKIMESFRNIYKYSLLKKSKRYIARTLLNK